MRNTMPTGASVRITGICGHDAGICDLTPRSRWPESLVTIPESAVTMKRNTHVGKTTIAQNIAHQAVLQGHTVVFTTAGKLLGELASLDSDSLLRTRLRHYARCDLLVIDEVGYLSYSSRYADLLFELISRRHEHKSTLITTNKSFAEWNEVFPNAACVVALVDRLVHHAEIVGIKGNSYRQKEAQERVRARTAKRKPSKEKEKEAAT